MASKIKTFPTLYFKDKLDRTREWKIWVEGSTIHKTYGIKGGKVIEGTREYRGVNKGRANETSAREQAILEAEREWIKRLDKGYYAKSTLGIAKQKAALEAKRKQGGTNARIEGTVTTKTAKPKTAKAKAKAKAKADNGTVDLPEDDVTLIPMQCHPFTDEKKCLKYFDFDEGVYINPKLDGIRCVARLVKVDDEWQVVLQSRTGKQFVHLKHIRKQILYLLKGNEDVVLDGELYAEHIYGNYTKLKTRYEYSAESDNPENELPELPQEQKFDVISGACRPVRTSPHPLESQISYHIFDVIDLNLDQKRRYDLLGEILSAKSSKKIPNIVQVDWVLVDGLDEIYQEHDVFIEKGYEGIVLREKYNKYQVGRRSLTMRKYKAFVDQEYEIVGTHRDKGVDVSQFVWVVQVSDEDARTFHVKPMGITEQKQQWYQDRKEYVGKLLTVRYQKPLVSEDETDHLPRFPRGVSIRDYE